MSRGLFGSKVGRAAFRGLVAAPHPVLFLDLDGTLAPLVDRADHAAVPAATRRTMAALRASGAKIVLVSGRDVASVERIAQCPVDAIIGNHGADIRQNGRSRRWLTGSAASLQVAARRIAATLHVPRAVLQEKPFSLALHYRGPAHRGVECMRIARQAIRGLDLEAHPGHRLVDIRLVSVNKGAAVRRWLTLMEPGLPRSAVCYAGDDTTDEYAFRALHSPAVTIAVGRRTKGARLRTSGPQAFAKWLARLAEARRRS